MQVLVDAKAVVDQGCDGSIIGVVVAGDVNDPNGVFCQVTVSGRDESFAKDAVARAAVEFSAAAVARAVAEVTLDCEVIGNGYACALGDADVRAVAKVFPSSPPADRL